MGKVWKKEEYLIEEEKGRKGGDKARTEFLG